MAFSAIWSEQPRQPTLIPPFMTAVFTSSGTGAAWFLFLLIAVVLLCELCVELLLLFCWGDQLKTWIRWALV